jgi:hypothetical protein
MGSVDDQLPEEPGTDDVGRLRLDIPAERRGYGAQVVGLVADIVRSEGGIELLTSYVEGAGGPAGFYARLGFEPTGGVDPEGEIIMRLPLSAEVRPTS